MFANIFAALAAEPGEPDRLMIDATHLNPKFSIVAVNGSGRQTVEHEFSRLKALQPQSSVDRLPPPAPPLRQ